MKNLVKILLILVLAAPVLAQSDRKIEKNSRESYMYVKIVLNDSEMFHVEHKISCNQERLKIFVNKRNILIHGFAIDFDIKIVKRNVGKYNSWVGKDGDQYYFITPFLVKDVPGGSGVMIQPVDETLNRQYDVPAYIFSNVDVICK